MVKLEWAITITIRSDVIRNGRGACTQATSPSTQRRRRANATPTTFSMSASTPQEQSQRIVKQSIGIMRHTRQGVLRLNAIWYSNAKDICSPNKPRPLGKHISKLDNAGKPTWLSPSLFGRSTGERNARESSSYSSDEELPQPPCRQRLRLDVARFVSERTRGRFGYTIFVSQSKRPSSHTWNGPRSCHTNSAAKTLQTLFPHHAATAF